MMDRAFGKLLEVKFASSSEGVFTDTAVQSHKLVSYDFLARTTTSAFGTYHANVRVLIDPVVCVQSYNVLRYVPLGKP